MWIIDRLHIAHFFLYVDAIGDLNFTNDGRQFITERPQSQSLA